jgi:NDP-sugar pyrophosphorylase family protein
MRVVGFQEKPSHPRSSLANGGVYVVEADAYREIADLRAHDIGFDVLPRFVGRMRGWEWTDYHVDIGTHGSLAQANADVERGAMKLGWSRT